jgi:SSS family solute:Na+ symporter
MAANEAAAESMGSIAYVVVGAYLLMLLVLGLLGYLRSHDSEEDYYLAGRQQGWIVSSLTIMATFFSSFALLGAPGMVYKEGVVFALFSLNVPVAGLCVYLLGKRIWQAGRQRGYVTPADMVAEHYGSPVALRLLVALAGLLYVIPYVVMQIQAGGLLSDKLFGSAELLDVGLTTLTSFDVGCAVLAAITMIYIMIGGMRSVAWTDAVQGLLLMAGMLVGGLAVVAVLHDQGGFGAAVAKLPKTSLEIPGTSGNWKWPRLFTICVLASAGSMVQPAQWMRFYAARSPAVLKRSALIFAIVLTSCFLFGTMLVGLGGQVLYPLQAMPDGTFAANPQVGEFDQILIVVLKHQIRDLLPTIGPLFASLMIVAIMGAAMSTADSNLHALSALLTRDVYDRWIRPNASQHERTWVGRFIIFATTSVALVLVMINQRNPNFTPMKMIVEMGFVAIAFSAQLLPVAVDMLYVKRGTASGAAAGLASGLVAAFLFGNIFPLLAKSTWIEANLSAIADLQNLLDGWKQAVPVDASAWGLAVNVIIFVLVSSATSRRCTALPG